MLEARGYVVAVEPGQAWIESARQSACGSCASKGHCGTGLMGDALSGGGHVSRVMALDSIGVAVGDEVIVGLPEEGMLQASLLLYGLPLLGLVGGMVAAQPLGEGAAIASGVAGLLAGLALVRPLTRRLLGGTPQPVVLSRVPAARVVACSRS